MPLPQRETLSYVNQTLPSLNSLNIIIDSIPSKNKHVIWRSLINLKNIVKALQWLKINNLNYKNIEISKLDKFPIDEIFIENDIEIFDVSEEPCNLDRSPMLQHKTSMVEIESEFTLFEMNKNIPNVTDIEKYDQKRVDLEPIDIKNPNLDHLCFPNVFPYGAGGMYDQRPVHVSPVLFAKWILRQKNNIARSNIPYIFSLCHSKDIRALDAGIFASLRTSKIRDLNAANLLKKIQENDMVLEASLSTMFSSVRGTREYWSRQCGDIELMDEYNGPATFFLTFSSAEYNWADHEEFMRKMNNVKDDEHVDISKLNVKDPISVSTHFHNRFSTFLNQVILNENGPFGKVIIN